MERAKITAETKFEPELYCLRCQHMDWDDDNRRCANFQQPSCPLDIRALLASLHMHCLVV